VVSPFAESRIVVNRCAPPLRRGGLDLGVAKLAFDFDNY